VKPTLSSVSPPAAMLSVPVPAPIQTPLLRVAR